MSDEECRVCGRAVAETATSKPGDAMSVSFIPHPREWVAFIDGEVVLVSEGSSPCIYPENPQGDSYTIVKHVEP